MSIEDAQSTIRATVANALAEALILGIDEVAQRGEPALTQRQQVALAAMTVMSYDNALEAVEDLKVWEDTMWQGAVT